MTPTILVSVCAEWTHLGYWDETTFTSRRPRASTRDPLGKGKSDGSDRLGELTHRPVFLVHRSSISRPRTEKPETPCVPKDQDDRLVRISSLMTNEAQLPSKIQHSSC